MLNKNSIKNLFNLLEMKKFYKNSKQRKVGKNRINDLESAGREKNGPEA
jgi:hypothetical protein